MLKNVKKLLQKLDSAKSVEEINIIIENIAAIGEPAVEELLHHTKQLYKKPAEYLTIIRILQKIGYPSNQKAIPFMVDQAANINSSGWEVAINTLTKIGDPAIPAIKEALQYYSRDFDEYAIELQGLTTLLEIIGPPMIDPLLPELLYILDSGNDINNVDLYALLPIKKIGSPKANAAIFHIGKMIDSQRSKMVKNAALEALIDFDPKSIISLIPIIKKNLNNDDESIRKNAELLMQKLE